MHKDDPDEIATMTGWSDPMPKKRLEASDEARDPLDAVLGIFNRKEFIILLEDAIIDAIKRSDGFIGFGKGWILRDVIRVELHEEIKPVEKAS